MWTIWHIYLIKIIDCFCFFTFFQNRDLLLVQIQEEIKRLGQTASPDTQSGQTNTAQGRDQQRRIRVTQTPVNSSDKLEIGDHVVFHRFFYDHHGIIISKNGQTFGVIEAKKNEGGKVQLAYSEIIFDFEKDKVSVASYTERYSKQETARRAFCIYDESRKHPGSYIYNVFTNNCEHFATFCATGIRYSLQVADLFSWFAVVY